MIRALLFCAVFGLVSAGLAAPDAVRSSAQGAPAPAASPKGVVQTLTAANLVKGSGRLAPDGDATGGQAAEVEKAYDLGFGPTAEPGLYRMRLRLKATRRVTGSLRAVLSSGNAGQGKYVRDEAPLITEQELPEPNQWREITRTFRLTSPSYWGMVSGTWPGLRLDRLSLERITEPAVLRQIETGKLLYALNEPASVTVRLMNATPQPQPVQVRVRVESGLSDVREGKPLELTLPAVTREQRIAGADVTEVKLPLPALAEYGNAVTVRLLQGGTSLGELTEYCYASNRPMQVGQYFGWSFPNDYTCSTAPAQFARMRRTYFPVTECFFWAPCDASMLAPDADRWWSGETLLRLSKKPLQEMIHAGHEQGLSFISYAARWGFGWRMWEFARRHPDLVEWEAQAWQPTYSVSHMEVEERERDADHQGLISSGVLSQAWGNPEAVASHVRQLQASMRMFGWDGFRYDNGSPVLDEVEDVFGRSLPLPGWDHARCIAALRDGIRAVKPGAVYGNNTGWNLDLNSRPDPRDPYTQQVRDGGLIMQEGETNSAANHRAFAEDANRYFRAGYNAIRFGGHQVNILDPYLTGASHYYQAALTAAGSCHIAYGVADEARALMQLVCRHCDLFYGDGLQFVLQPESVVSVNAPAGVLWRDYVRFRELSPTRREYLVHLIKPPPGVKLGDDKESRLPEPVAGVQTSWTLPAGWKAARAYELTADGGYGKKPLPLTVENGIVRVTLPQLRRWSMVVIDAAAVPPRRGGAASAARKVRRPGASAPAPKPASGQTNPFSFTGQAAEPLPGNLVNPATHGLRYLPSQTAAVRSAADFKVEGANPLATPGAAGGRALALGPAGLGNGIGFQPQIGSPGQYRLVIRAVSLTPPPANGALTGLFSAANNDATPGARYLANSFRFGAASFRAPGEWVELSAEGAMTFPNYWFSLTGGWEGLVLDTVSFTRVRPLASAEMARGIQRGWPENVKPVSHGAPRVWFGAGLYYRLTQLPEALAELGAEVDLAKAWRFRGPVGFDLPFPKTPEALAAYDMVVLANCEARSLTPEQQYWLDGYVQRGGRLLLLGGPYGLGSGRWDEASLLAGMLPVALAPHDLRFTGRTAPVELKPSGELARGLDWSAHPVVLWQHALQPKPGAVVHLTAGETPAIVSGAYGRGAVAVVGLAPLGEAPKGATPYWEWPQWRSVMVRLLRSMLPAAKTARR